MRLRTFRAESMQTAMDAVRAAMGADAIIIGTEHEPGGKFVRVTAAIDSEEVPEESIGGAYAPPTEPVRNGEPAIHRIAAAKPLQQEQGVLQEMEGIFRFHSIPQPLVQRLMDCAKLADFAPDTSYEGLRKALSSVLSAACDFMPLPLSRTAFRIMLVGPPGVGKTISIAKLAAQMVMDKKHLVVVTTDIQRAGGVEQLEAFTQILGVPLKVADSRQELEAILRESDAQSRVLIDSSGCNPYAADELKGLEEFLGIEDVEPVLTVAAGCDPQEASHIARSFAFAQPRRLLVTRTDTSRRYGALLAAALTGDLAFCQASNSGKVVGEMLPMSADRLSRLLMQYRLDT